jgi:hypothetical protein
MLRTFSACHFDQGCRNEKLDKYKDFWGLNLNACSYIRIGIEVKGKIHDYRHPNEMCL